MCVDYEEFDKILMAEIWAGRGNKGIFTKQASPVSVAAESYRKKDPWRGRTPVARIIEKRLQALRREGRIRWCGVTWEIIDRRK